ncbi:MAG TPA: hypothetical protein VF614_17525 [Chthoniobacteraceae bacterium]|jgi:hypothetical protein
MEASSSPKLRHALAFTLLAVSSLATLARAQAPQTVGGLTEVPFQRLSSTVVSPLGKAALGIRPAEWKHTETTNFIYHYFQSFIATPVSVEAEFFYRIVAKELEKDTTQWERKSHIFIFEQDADWAEFQKRGSLDPWTGGIHAGGELFIQRNPAQKWKGNTLGHEVAHLVIHRFFGNGVPLWLNEGYAEYAASRGYSAFHRLRGYNSRPRAQAVSAERFIPLAELTQAVSYPADVLQVATFYAESERLVRFLAAANKSGFSAFLTALSQGNGLDSALAKGFAGRFQSLEALEREFKVYATKDHGTTLQD